MLWGWKEYYSVFDFWFCLLPQCISTNNAKVSLMMFVPAFAPSLVLNGKLLVSRLSVKDCFFQTYLLGLGGMALQEPDRSHWSRAVTVSCQILFGKTSKKLKNWIPLHAETEQETTLLQLYFHIISMYLKNDHNNADFVHFCSHTKPRRYVLKISLTCVISYLSPLLKIARLCPVSCPSWRVCCESVYVWTCGRFGFCNTVMT